MRDAPVEPWQWPEPHWRALVNQVRAGRPLRPRAWQGGARCAVALSFDSDHETSELRDGGKSIGRMSWGEFGSRVGVPRILDLLARHDVRGTFFVPAVAALLHPDEQRRVVTEGHEIGIHGWIHELNSVLPYEVERDQPDEQPVDAADDDEEQGERIEVAHGLLLRCLYNVCTRFVANLGGAAHVVKPLSNVSRVIAFDKPCTRSRKLQPEPV